MMKPRRQRPCESSACLLMPQERSMVRTRAPQRSGEVVPRTIRGKDSNETVFINLSDSLKGFSAGRPHKVGPTRALRSHEPNPNEQEGARNDEAKNYHWNVGGSVL